MNRFFFVFTLMGAVFFLAMGSVKGQRKNFDFNPRCEEAYQKIMELRIQEGKNLLAEEKQTNPENLVPYFLDNYIDFFSLFFDEGAKSFAAQLPLMQDRIALLKKGNRRSPYYLFSLAEINFQWSIIRIKFDDRWNAVWQFRKAYLELKENKVKFPNFSPNNMLLGSLETLIGTIPDEYKWFSNILGMDGNISTGMQLLDSYVRDQGPDGNLFKDEAYFYFAYLKSYVQNEPGEVFQLIREQHLDLKGNHLFGFMAINLALNQQKGDFGYQVMKSWEKGPQFMHLPSMDFERGMIYLDRLETDSSIFYLQRFIQNFKGKFYIKDALIELSWAYLLEGKMDRAQYYRNLIKTRGNAFTDADKSAQREALKGIWPDPVILKARLLSDGGYLSRALEVLTSKKVNDFPRFDQKLEYAYRLARIYDQLGDEARAVPLYEITIREGSNRPEYFAARSAWQLGLIDEKKGNKAAAIAHFQNCLQMNEREYKSSLDQKAKAGIRRLSGN
ncbi:MAG: tetratricopeptide repeat protein [Chitinophagaceae bacterium]